MIIGLTGTKAGGKGVAANILKEKGFAYLSLSDIVREEAKSRGIENPTIFDFQDIGNDLREKEGTGALAKRAIAFFKFPGNLVIDGIRNPGEVEEFRKADEFFLIAVDALQEIRFKRLIERARQSDPKSWEDFLAMERRDMGLAEKTSGQMVGGCMEMADYLIFNTGSLEELKTKIEDVYAKILSNRKDKKRPTWDEYFMEMTRTVAKRATCDRGKSGCVIVREKQILVSGYVGSPIGLPHCDEVGHQMKTVVHEDGTSSQHCMRTVHAEQNAICQAAKLGIPLDGSTLYCKMTPCSTCAKLVINSGIKRVVCEKRYHQGMESEELFKDAGVKLDILNPEVETYKNQ